MDCSKKCSTYQDDNKVFQVVGYPDLEASNIWFSQDSVYHKFADGRDLQRAFNQLAMGELTPHGIPLRSAVRTSDLRMTHDSRPLLLYQALEREGFLKTVPGESVITTIPGWQLTTKCDGRQCRKPGEPPPKGAREKRTAPKHEPPFPPPPEEKIRVAYPDAQAILGNSSSEDETVVHAPSPFR